MPKKRPLRRKSNALLYIGMILVVVLVLLGLKNVPSWYDNWLETPSSADETTQIFEIEAGTSGQKMAANLEKEGLVTSEWALYWYIRENELGQKIPIGRFVLSPSMTPYEIMETITGEAGQIVFTIPEGYTSSQIDDKLFEEGLIADDEFARCIQTCEFEGYETLEGYLFPDTYFINPNTFTVEGFISRLITTFESKILTDENLAEIESSGRTLTEIVIAASIIEKEVFLDKDMALVSGIIWKRYDANWALGMCSTVNYITGKQTVSYEDTEIDSPYNTYQNTGFPPTAISNPGLAAVEAAINPQTSDYWFFLNTLDTGETIYAVTNEQHNANKAIYLN